MFGHLAVVKQLVAAGSDLMRRNQDGLTAYHVAKQQKYTTVADYLEEKIMIEKKNGGISNGSDIKL